MSSGVKWMVVVGRASPDADFPFREIGASGNLRIMRVKESGNMENGDIIENGAQRREHCGLQMQTLAVTKALCQ